MLQKELNAEEADDVKWDANSLYGGGTDTVRVQHSLIIPEIPFKLRPLVFSNVVGLVIESFLMFHYTFE